jgi:hypothetical protein
MYALNPKTIIVNMNNYVLNAVACALIILSHFFNFILFSGYLKVFPDILIVAAGIVGIAIFLAGLMEFLGRFMRPIIFSLLITIVFSDVIFELGVANEKTHIIVATLTFLVALAVVFFLRGHATKVLIGAFGAMLFSSFILMPPDMKDANQGKTLAPQKSQNDLPPVIHIILDEHIGLKGMTQELAGGVDVKNDVMDFYQRHGMRLFGGSYSQFFKTPMSLGNMMNFSDSPNPFQFLNKKRDGWILKSNRYFEEMTRRGYRINIYQSRYLDFCKSNVANINKCIIYNQHGLHHNVVASLPLGERVKLIYRSYYSSISIYKLANYAGKKINQKLALYDLALPKLGLWHGQVGPLAVMPTLAQLINDISSTSGGTLFFAHLLMPHNPYVYDANCAILSPVSTWKLRYNENLLNTQKSRRQRYNAYFGQIRCTMKKLEPLFAMLRANQRFNRATIIIHGDHGSRITRILPSKKNLSSMTYKNYLDNYSTLFAIKAPWMTPEFLVGMGIKTKMLSLSQIINFVVYRKRENLTIPKSPTAYVIDDRGGYIETIIPPAPPATK